MLREYEGFQRERQCCRDTRERADDTGRARAAVPPRCAIPSIGARRYPRARRAVRRTHGVRLARRLICARRAASCGGHSRAALGVSLSDWEQLPQQPPLMGTCLRPGHRPFSSGRACPGRGWGRASCVRGSLGVRSPGHPPRVPEQHRARCRCRQRQPGLPGPCSPREFGTLRALLSPSPATAPPSAPPAG
jgi:hypothetical protein